jgi:hypothetical protein
MTLGRHLWRTGAIITIVISCLAIALLLVGSDKSIFFLPVWLLVASSLWLAVGELRRK